MRKWYLILTFVLALCLLSSYSYAGFWDGSTADISSFKDPDFPNYKIAKMAIRYSGHELNERDMVEKVFVNRFSKKETALETVTSLTYLPPTRTYTMEETDQILSDKGVNCIMLIKVTDSFEDEAYVPEQSKTTTYGRINETGDQFKAYSETEKSGGYYVSLPRMKVELTILDLKAHKTVWLASSFVKGSQYSSFKNLMDTIAAKAFKQLKKDGLVDIKE